MNELTITEIRNEIVRFNNDVTVQRLKAYYNEKTYPEILRVSRRELSHSSFICWLLNPNESHNLNHYGIKRLLEILITSKFWKSSREAQDLFDNIITDNFKISETHIFKEYAIGSKGRLDILLEFIVQSGQIQSKVRIIIENKVASNEGLDQTNRYYTFFNEKQDNFVNLFVFLTAISSLDLDELNEPECLNKNFIHINYQSIVDSLLEPSLLVQGLNPNTKFIIQQYIQSLSQPSFEYDDLSFERGMIMAIGSEERELLQKFWGGNKNLILAVLYAISSDPNQEKDVRDTVKQALTSIASTGKDRSAIIINYEGEKIAEIQKSDIGYETIRLLAAKKLINDDIVTWLKEDNSSGLKLIKQKHQMTSNEIKYRKYRINNDPEFVYNNEEYYIARNWGLYNIHRFINKIVDRFPNVKYIINNEEDMGIPST